MALIASQIKEVFPLREDGPAKHVLLRSREGMVLLLGLATGQTLPPHRHPGYELQILVVEGEGRFFLQGEARAVKAAAVLSCGGDEDFGVQNDGANPLYVLVVLRPSGDVLA